MTRPEHPDEPLPPAGGTIRPPEQQELPPEQLGSTAQFKAFATGDDSAPAAAAARHNPAIERAERAAHLDRPDVPLESSSESTATLQPPGLPPVRSDSKRGLIIAAAVVVLVAIVIALLFFLM